MPACDVVNALPTTNSKGADVSSALATSMPSFELPG